MSAFDANWSLMTPEIVLAALALIIFTIDFMTGIHGKKPFLGRMSILALVVTFVLVLFTNSTGGSIEEIFVVDSFARIFKLIIIFGVIMVIAISMHYLERNKDVYQGEYYSLMLFATLGAMIMVSSADLITLFVGLELLSISTYCLAAFKKYNRKSTEGAIKYVVLGGTASAFILYGMSFLYGLTGSTSLIDIALSMQSLYADYPFIIIMSFLFILGGFGFKISSVPFHMWAPDVYEGSPTPVTAFLSIVSKIAGFAILIRVLFISYGLGMANALSDHWYIVFPIIAAITMIVGNVIALTQRNVKRLMAYSGIAQAGYLLVPVAILFKLGNEGYMTVSLGMIAFYAVAYVLMTAGAFAVITLVTEDAGKEDLSTFNGLYKRAPYMAVSMAIFLVSLAGLPLTAGFAGKAWIFTGAITADMIWLSIIMIVASVVSFYYYFVIIRQMFMREPNPDASQLQTPFGLSVVVSVTLAFTVILGLLPGLLTNWMPYINWMF
ncbi:NADH-quinone oxidoreductase subunit N [Evansella cellulosilytica]|uniref:NADH-quinone oxidoreductase subunit N n=1 Tax=Evansella cellulosilytica (strain ATCC 21833 / DSM 2522 / FERM P-1141 / JCM 9156 / N-4) TaxID=649639 RepID=E6TX90_EVAC2|nr:NADH-quinone oxidoreductase subunit N [Evansella cellulosilytica]ADU32285.1 proton-translocating NADH-quinone oxidoreductase, chain N [Evansella cellulosilytica DSM 2522]